MNTLPASDGDWRSNKLKFQQSFRLLIRTACEPGSSWGSCGGMSKTSGVIRGWCRGLSRDGLGDLSRFLPALRYCCRTKRLWNSTGCLFRAQAQADPVPELPWASPVLGRQRPMSTGMKRPLQQHLPVPCKDVALPTQGTQAAYTRAIRAQAEGMPCRPGGKQKPPHSYRKPAASPTAPVQLFPERKKNQIKSIEQHTRAECESCSPE